jgi:outer membrane protein assembly factor BamA
VFLGSEKHVATPWYGVGNASPFDETADDGTNPSYYRFGRTRRRVAANLQYAIGSTPLRLLAGAGATRVEIDLVPDDGGTTLFAEDLAASGSSDEPVWLNHVRAGLVWDTRDRETGPRRGTWTELLVQRVSETLGSDHSYTRWTLTDRRYFPLLDRLVLANRVLVQGVSDDPPLHDLSVIQTSFKQQEGPGGAKTLRGVRKNRYAGRGLLVWNAELRWRAADFRLFGRPFHTVLSAFVDSGRVWEGDVVFGELLTGLHHGVGGGVRLGMGENFIVALDAGTSAETALPFYIGLGYLF